MFLNEATLLHNLKIRYQKDKIYVSFNLLYTIYYMQLTAPVLLVFKLIEGCIELCVGSAMTCLPSTCHKV